MSDATIGIFLFLLAASIRAIPEFKAGVWPIGYDTFNTYAAELASYSGPLVNWLKTANLIYFIFLPFKFLGINPGMIMKIFGPIFFGAIVASFYLWAKYFVKLNTLKSFLASLLIVFQLATLRISWDLYRNELGLIFFFFACINLLRIEKPKNLIYFSLLSILIIFSNELVSAVLLVVTLVYLFRYIKHKETPNIKRLIVPFGLASILFFMVINSSGQSIYNANIIFTSAGNNLFLRYFYKYQQDMSYGQLASIINQMFCLLYGYLIPFALIGFWLLRKNIILTTITLWLVAGTFSSLLFAGTGIIVWERWLYMLAFPFAVYGTEAIFQIGGYINRALKKWHFHLRPSLLTLAVVFWVAYIGLFVIKVYPFLTTDYVDAKPPLANDLINSYFPRTMIHNSVGLWKIETVLECVDWLNQKVPSGAAVIVDNRWRGLMLTNFTMDNRYIITNAWSEEPPKESFDFAVKKGFKKVYLIWNAKKNIRYFNLVQSCGNTSIYESKPLGQN